MEFKSLMQFIEYERVKQNIRKNSLCASADITPQYYHLLTEGRSIPNWVVVDKLVTRLGYDLAPIVRVPELGG